MWQGDGGFATQIAFIARCPNATACKVGTPVINRAKPFTRGTPRGLLGSIGLMAVHSWSDQADPIYEYTA
jgi:hypothetical protein